MVEVSGGCKDDEGMFYREVKTYVEFPVFPAQKVEEQMSIDLVTFSDGFRDQGWDIDMDRLT